MTTIAHYILWQLRIPLKSWTFSFFETMHALLALSETDNCRSGTGGMTFFDEATPSSLGAVHITKNH